MKKHGGSPKVMWGYMAKPSKIQLILASGVWREPRDFLELGLSSDLTHTPTYHWPRLFRGEF